MYIMKSIKSATYFAIMNFHIELHRFVCKGYTKMYYRSFMVKPSFMVNMAHYFCIFFAINPGIMHYSCDYGHCIASVLRAHESPWHACCVEYRADDGDGAPILSFGFTVIIICCKILHCGRKTAK